MALDAVEIFPRPEPHLLCCRCPTRDRLRFSFSVCFRGHVKQGDGLLVLQTEGPRVSILTHRTFSDENRF